MGKFVNLFVLFGLLSSVPLKGSGATSTHTLSHPSIVCYREIPIPDPNSSRNPIGKFGEIPIPDPNSSKNPVG